MHSNHSSSLRLIVVRRLQGIANRLGRIFPSTEASIDFMKSSSYIHLWSTAVEGYYLYELEDVEGGVRCNIDHAHIQEEAESLRKFEPVMGRMVNRPLIPNGLMLRGAITTVSCFNPILKETRKF